MEPLRLSIVVPVYNERTRLNHGLKTVLAFMDAADFAIELVVVDDGSSDETPRLIERMIAGRAGAQLIRLPRNRGKGTAVKTGMDCTAWR